VPEVQLRIFGEFRGRKSLAEKRTHKIGAKHAAEKQRGKTMSAFHEHKEELEHYEQMFGRERGRLAVSLDRLTNALVLVGQHGVYCTSGIPRCRRWICA